MAVEILVTGATGFVGPHLVSALVAQGYRVSVLALPNEDTDQFGWRDVGIHRGDIREAQTLGGAFKNVEIVFHLAAIHGLWRPRNEYYEVNLAGTENVCRAALAARVRRLVHLSTWTVYGFGLGRPVNEDAPLRHVADTYQITKVDSDNLVRRYLTEEKLPATIIRPGTIFGDGDRINFGRMADNLRASRAIIIGSGRNALPFVHVTDVVQGMILAAFEEKARGEIYNISNDQPLTQEEMWRAIAGEIGASPPRFRVPYPFLYAVAAVAEKMVGRDNPRRQPLVTRYGVQIFGTDNRHSIEKARSELGYVPKVNLREGIRMTAKWYLNQRASLRQ